MDWDQFKSAMAGLGYQVANTQLDGALVCQMIWRCPHPGCTNTAQVLQEATDLQNSPALAFIFDDMALEARQIAKGECRH